MPESERPEREREISESLDRLTGAVDRILADYEAIKTRGREIEGEYSSLREAVTGSGGADCGDLEDRLGRLAAENKLLRETLIEAQARAKRIRSQLAVVEDEI